MTKTTASAAKDLAEYENESARLDAMEQMRLAKPRRRVLTQFGPLSGSKRTEDGVVRKANELGKTVEQVEDEMVEQRKHSFVRPFDGSDASSRMHTRYKQRQEWNKMRGREEKK